MVDRIVFLLEFSICSGVYFPLVWWSEIAVQFELRRKKTDVHFSFGLTRPKYLVYMFLHWFLFSCAITNYSRVR